MPATKAPAKPLPQKRRLNPPVITGLRINGVDINATSGVVILPLANTFALDGTYLPYGGDVAPASVVLNFETNDDDVSAVLYVDSTSSATSCTGFFYYLRSPAYIPKGRRHAAIRKSRLSVTISAPPVPPGTTPTVSAPYPYPSVLVVLPR